MGLTSPQLSCIPNRVLCNYMAQQQQDCQGMIVGQDHTELLGTNNRRLYPAYICGMPRMMRKQQETLNSGPGSLAVATTLLHAVHPTIRAIVWPMALRCSTLSSCSCDRQRVA